MKLLSLMILSLILFPTNSSADNNYSFSDFTVTTENLDSSRAQKFKDSASIETLVYFFNLYEVTYDVAPVKIFITNNMINDSQSQLFLRIDIRYRHRKVFKPSGDYFRHNEKWSQKCQGVSLLLLDQIFKAVTEYKSKVAMTDSGICKKLFPISNSVRLNKWNGKWVEFSSYNPQYPGATRIHPYIYFVNAFVSSKPYGIGINCDNLELLHHENYFCIQEKNEKENHEILKFKSFFKIE